MNAALGWIGDVAAWLASWIPRLVHVQVNERAVKFIRGRAVSIDPGLHVYWPLTTNVESMAVVRQVATVEPQVLVTKSVEVSQHPLQSGFVEHGVTVIVGGVVVYSISDLYRFLVENENAHASVDEIAKAAIRRAVVRRTYEAVQEDRADVDNTLSREVQRALEPFGIEVERVSLTDFAPTQVISLFGDAVSVQVRS